MDLRINNQLHFLQVSNMMRDHTVFPFYSIKDIKLASIIVPIFFIHFLQVLTSAKANYVHIHHLIFFIS